MITDQIRLHSVLLQLLIIIIIRRKLGNQIGPSLPLIRDVIPNRLTKMLSVASEPVNNSPVTYKSGFTCLAASTKY